MIVLFQEELEYDLASRQVVAIIIRGSTWDEVGRQPSVSLERKVSVLALRESRLGADQVLDITRDMIRHELRTARSIEDRGPVTP